MAVKDQLEQIVRDCRAMVARAHPADLHKARPALTMTEGSHRAILGIAELRGGTDDDRLRGVLQDMAKGLLTAEEQALVDQQGGHVMHGEFFLRQLPR